MENELAPGCFGSALTFQEGSPVCQQCPFASSCAPKSQASYERIAEKLGIKEKKKAKLPPKVEPSGQNLVQTLPKKVQEIMGWLERKKVVITGPLRNGINPIPGRPTFLRVACHMLLRTKLGIDHGMLKMGLMKSLGWNELSADAYARVAIQLLTAVGAITEANGRYSISRE